MHSLGHLLAIMLMSPDITSPSLHCVKTYLPLIYHVKVIQQLLVLVVVVMQLRTPMLTASTLFVEL